MSGVVRLSASVSVCCVCSVATSWLCSRVALLACLVLRPSRLLAVWLFLLDFCVLLVAPTWFGTPVYRRYPLVMPKQCPPQVFAMKSLLETETGKLKEFWVRKRLYFTMLGFSRHVFFLVFSGYNGFLGSMTHAPLFPWAIALRPGLISLVHRL